MKSRTANLLVQFAVFNILELAWDMLHPIQTIRATAGAWKWMRGGPCPKLSPEYIRRFGLYQERCFDVARGLAKEEAFQEILGKEGSHLVDPATRVISSFTLKALTEGWSYKDLCNRSLEAIRDLRDLLDWYKELEGGDAEDAAEFFRKIGDRNRKYFQNQGSLH